MKHSYYKGKNQKLIIMLHGTGGDENDLVNIAKYIDEEAHLLGIRGNVKEGLANRYFKRLSDGSFDEQDLNFRSHELYESIQSLIKDYHLENFKIHILGYSNGANIFLHILKLYSTEFNSAILLHPSSGIETLAFKEQKYLNAFITYGDNDPFITKSSFIKLKEDLEKAKIKTMVYQHNQGHQIIQEELEEAKLKYREQRNNA